MYFYIVNYKIFLFGNQCLFNSIYRLLSIYFKLLIINNSEKIALQISCFLIQSKMLFVKNNYLNITKSRMSILLNKNNAGVVSTMFEIMKKEKQ